MNMITSILYSTNRKVNHDHVMFAIKEHNINAIECSSFKRDENNNILEEKYYSLTPENIKALDIVLAKKQDDVIVISSNGLSVRYVLKDDKPFFVARDVASQLGYSDTNKMTSRLDEDEFITSKTEGMNMKVTFLTESGLYNAILGSKKQEAKKFKRFVTEEVLPSIRKHGVYATIDTIEKMIANPETAIKLLEVIKKEKQRVSELRNEVTIKQKVIDALSEDCPMPDKRQVLNIVLRKTGVAFQERWQQLYAMFDKTYHKNTSLLCNNYNNKFGTKLSRLDYIVDILGQLDNLYSIAVKLYETDVNSVLEKMFDINRYPST